MDGRYLYEKNGVKLWDGSHNPEYPNHLVVLKGDIIINKPPASVFDGAVDVSHSIYVYLLRVRVIFDSFQVGPRRKLWDRLSSNHMIVEELARDSQHVVCLWRMRSVTRFASTTDRHSHHMR